MTVPEVDGRHRPGDGHPVGQHAVGIGALVLALDGDDDGAGAVVAGDMGLVRPEIAQKDRGVVEAGALRKARDVEADRGIDQVGEDRGGHREGEAALAGEAPGDRVGKAGCEGGGHRRALSVDAENHAPCPLSPQLR